MGIQCAIHRTFFRTPLRVETGVKGVSDLPTDVSGVDADFRGTLWRLGFPINPAVSEPKPVLLGRRDATSGFIADNLLSASVDDVLEAAGVGCTTEWALIPLVVFSSANIPSAYAA